MAMSNLVGREITDYSRLEKGDPQNHYLSVRFDVTDGYVGITQLEGDRVKSRVLLSPAQWQALTAFLKSAKRHRRLTR